MTGERLNPLRLWPDGRPVDAGIPRRIGEPGINRRLPTMADGGHTFGLFLDSPEVGPINPSTGRRWPLWHCVHCYANVPGWLLAEGLVDRCHRPAGRRALPPATQHRDPRRTP